MEKKWKVIKENDNYEVSNYGEVRRAKQTWGSYKKGTLLKTSVNMRGYCQVVLCKNKTRNTRTVHSLVAEAFFGEKPTFKNSRTEINHIDGNKQNNNRQNLQYVSAKENKHHAIATGLHKSVGGKKIKINYEIAQKIRKLRSDGLRNVEISKLFKIRQSLVSDVVNNRCWL